MFSKRICSKLLICIIEAIIRLFNSKLLMLFVFPFDGEFACSRCLFLSLFLSQLMCRQTDVRHWACRISANCHYLNLISKLKSALFAVMELLAESRKESRGCASHSIQGFGCGMTAKKCGQINADAMQK